MGGQGHTCSATTALPALPGAGWELVAVQELLGHRWVATTMRYVQALFDVDAFCCHAEGGERFSFGGEVLFVGDTPA